MGLGATQGSHCSAWTEKFLVGGRLVGDFHVKKHGLFIGSLEFLRRIWDI